MKIPLKYNLRSLWVRRVGTLMTALGVGLTVAIVITMMALVNGLDSTFVETGHDNHLVVLRQGSLNETNSYFNLDLLEIMRFLPGVSTNAENEPLAAGEIVVIINHPRVTGESSNVMMRGTSEVGFELRPEVKITQGRKFRRGLREIMVSRPLSKRFQDMGLGDTIHIARSDWRVVGIFETDGTAYDSELWGDYNEIATEWNRPAYSSVLLKAEDAEAAEKLQQRIADDNRIQLEAIPQKEYFRGQTI
ncbi:ABC transporter permease, partial [Acidobacteria bacterium AH-259-L09]|nr:ABC transporter permease [Acidobacteria bacterium AH-259-L09]